MKTTVAFVGGFLGAGKTTLLFNAAEKLTRMGKRVGLITNDQASGLVDTEFLKHTGVHVAEVCGSCFCCNFNGLTDAIFKIRSEDQADIIIAEPVGSCTDLSATLMQPLKQNFKEELSIAPLTVLADPEQLASILEGETAGLCESAAYIIGKQFEEADIVAVSKTDLLSTEKVKALMERAKEKWPKATILSENAKDNDTLENWIAEIQQPGEAGGHLAKVDYDIYAKGEAILGWLNASFLLKSQSADWDAFAARLIHALKSRFTDLRAPIGHVKVLIENQGHSVFGNITGQNARSIVRGSAGVGKEARMVLNARVQISPDDLEHIVCKEIERACGSGIAFTTSELKCFRPGRPNPTFHFDHVVEN